MLHFTYQLVVIEYRVIPLPAFAWKFFIREEKYGDLPNS